MAATTAIKICHGLDATDRVHSAIPLDSIEAYLAKHHDAYEITSDAHNRVYVDLDGRADAHLDAAGMEGLTANILDALRAAMSAPGDESAFMESCKFGGWKKGETINILSFRFTMLKRHGTRDAIRAYVMTTLAPRLEKALDGVIHLVVRRPREKDKKEVVLPPSGEFLELDASVYSKGRKMRMAHQSKSYRHRGKVAHEKRPLRLVAPATVHDTLITHVSADSVELPAPAVTPAVAPAEPAAAGPLVARAAAGPLVARAARVSREPRVSTPPDVLVRVLQGVAAARWGAHDDRFAILQICHNGGVAQAAWEAMLAAAAPSHYDAEEAATRWASYKPHDATITAATAWAWLKEDDPALFAALQAEMHDADDVALATRAFLHTPNQAKAAALFHAAKPLDYAYHPALGWYELLPSGAWRNYNGEPHGMRNAVHDTIEATVGRERAWLLRTKGALETAAPEAPAPAAVAVAAAAPTTAPMRAGVKAARAQALLARAELATAKASARAANDAAARAAGDEAAVTAKMAKAKKVGAKAAKQAAQVATRKAAEAAADAARALEGASAKALAADEAARAAAVELATLEVAAHVAAPTVAATDEEPSPADATDEEPSPADLAKQQLHEVSGMLRAIPKLLLALGTKAFVDGTIAFLTHLYTDDELPSKMDESLHLFAFTDAVYDLEAREARPIRRDDWVCITTGYPFPRSVDEETKAKLEQLLWSIWEDADMQAFVLRTVAQALHGRRQFEQFYTPSGEGRNGKGVLSDLLRLGFGGYYQSVPSTVLTKAPDKVESANTALATAKGRRFLQFDEPEETDRWQGGAVKRMSGGDEQVARQNYARTFVTYKPQFVMWAPCNGVPKFNRIDGAVKDRGVVIPFSLKFVGTVTEPHHRPIDRTIKAHLRGASAPKWRDAFIDLLLRVFPTIKPTGLEPPAAVTSATAAYMQDNNPLHEWLQGHYVRHADVDTRRFWQSSTAMLTAYTADTAGKPAPRLNKNNFATYMKLLDVPNKDVKHRFIRKEFNGAAFVDADAPSGVHWLGLERKDTRLEYELAAAALATMEAEERSGKAATQATPPPQSAASAKRKRVEDARREAEQDEEEARKRRCALEQQLTQLDGNEDDDVVPFASPPASP